MADKLPCPMSATELLDRYYLDMRCHVLELASAFDRIERARDSQKALNDVRYKRLMESFDILRQNGTGRTREFLEKLSVE
jgi:hypothetical protein